MWSFLHTLQQKLPTLLAPMSVAIIGCGVVVVLLRGSTMSSPTLQVAFATLIADIRQQQSLSRLGEVAGKHSVVPFGIVFQDTQYALFQGKQYVPGRGPEQLVALPASVVVETNLPSGVLLFESGTGNLIGFNGTKNTITMRHTATQVERSISFNLYGVITLKN